MKSIKISGIRKMFDLASENVIHLGLGELDFQPPENAINALKKALEEGKNKYGPSAGISELREAIAERNKRYRKDLKEENVVVTTSGTEALMATMLTFIQKNDEVLIPDPGFVLYQPQIKLCGGKAVRYGLLEKNRYKPDLDKLRGKVTSHTKALVMNFPSNPIGSILEKKDVSAIVEIAEEKDLLIISDEVYDEIVYDCPHQSFLGEYENVVFINSFSKTYAMTGWRIGYIVTNEEFVKQIVKTHYYLVACPPTPMEYAVLELLRDKKDYTKKMVAELKKRRNLIVGKLNSIPGFHCLLPKGAFYAFPKYDFNISSHDFAMKILKNNVLCTPGSAFGVNGENHLRFSYANSMENIEKGMEIVKKVAEEL